MTVYLGIDGGGTGCRAAVVDTGGRLLGQAEGASANVWTDPTGALANILATARQALAGAPGVADADVVAVLGLAGANVSGAAERVVAALPFGRVRVESDAVVALKGALGDEDGIAAALGTGSVFGAQQGGRVTMIGGWGFQLGDWASGAVMGRALCSEALLAGDGEVPSSPLLGRVLAEHGGAQALVAWGKGASPAAFARLVPGMIEAAAEGDAAAEAILARATEEVARAVGRLRRDGPLPVTFLGGLGPVFAARLAGRWPVRAAKGNGLDGALLMARRLG